MGCVSGIFVILFEVTTGLPFLADPSEARGCSINTIVINLVKISLWCHNALMVDYGAAILLNGWIKPIGGASALEGL